MRNFITFLTILFLTLFVNSCTSTKVVPVREAHHSEHFAIDKDSVHIVDSIYIYINGDTIRETRWRDRWRDRMLRDTLWLVDTIPKIETVIVEKDLGFWDNIKLKTWNIIAGVLFIIFIIYIIKFKLRGL